MDVWKEHKKRQKEIEKQAKNDIEVEHLPSISMLLMLWNVYDCWDTPYYDKLVHLKDKVATSVFKYSPKLPQHERDKLKDKNRLGYNPNYNHDSHIHLASIEQTEEIVSVLLSHYSNNSSRFSYLIQGGGNSFTDLKKLENVIRCLVKHFIEKYQIWVYVEGDEYRTVRAAALWEQPAQHDHALPLNKLQRLKLAKKISPEFNKIFFTDQGFCDGLRNQHYQNIESDMGVLHYFGYWHEEGDCNSSDTFRFCLTVLLFDIAEALPPYIPAYAQATDDQSWTLREIGYSEMLASTPPHASIPIIKGFLYIKEGDC